MRTHRMSGVDERRESDDQYQSSEGCNALEAVWDVGEVVLKELILVNQPGNKQCCE